MTDKDVGLRTLLDLSVHVIDQEHGYSLTLHAPGGQRILGYDNAHAVRIRRGRHGGRRLPFDHKHRRAADTGVPYEFGDAQQRF